MFACLLALWALPSAVRAQHHGEVHGARDKREQRARRALLGQRHLQRALPEHGRELRVRQRQSPQTEVRRRVRHAAQHELNRLDALVNHNVAHAVLLVPIVPAVRVLAMAPVAVATLPVPPIQRR